MKKLFLLISFFFFSGNIFSQQEYVIVRGYVRGISSRETYTGQVKNAEIKITICDTIKFSQLSRENGYYEFYIEKAPVTAKIECIANRNTHFNTDSNSRFFSPGYRYPINLNGSWTYESDFSLTQMIVDVRYPETHFKKNSFEADGDSLADHIYRIMTAHPELVVQIDGHCDYNEQGVKKLSRRRAKLIVKQLRQKGIASGRLKSGSWGSERPVITKGQIDAAKSSAEQELLRQNNRRVAFRILSFDYGKK